MVQVLCIIMGFVYIAQRRTILRLGASEFPNVAPEEFEKWRTLELGSIKIFLWATWGTFVVGILVAVVSYANPGSIGFGISQLVLLGLFFAGLIVSAVKGTKAASLKRKLGISLRKP